jgi:cyclopropane-fatty-acyl-phospholipid synthase
LAGAPIKSTNVLRGDADDVSLVFRRSSPLAISVVSSLNSRAKRNVGFVCKQEAAEMKGARDHASQCFGSVPGFENLAAANRVAPATDRRTSRIGDARVDSVRVSAVDLGLVTRLLKMAGEPPVGVVLWDGERVTKSSAEPAATLYIHDRRALFGLLANPEIMFGDLYSAGRVEVRGDLIRFLEVVYTSIRELRMNSRFGWLRETVGHRRIANPIGKARDNIHHHYDIGNDFYQLWLDQAEMQYTCAYFPDPSMTLEQAQTAKLHHVCRKLRLQPGDTVVEAGCGWGGLARFMARHYGVSVTACNISHEQIEFARAEAERQGLVDRVRYLEDDYRNLTGQYDVFVSVGMLEHVGKRDYRCLGEVIKRCLKADGRGLIHSIGRVSPGPMNGWIERRIFPGAYPPSLAEMMDIFEPNRLSVGDVENLRLHYALTLKHWLQRFENNVDQVGRQYGEAFVRAWRLYLAGSVAAFTTDELQLYQVVFSVEGNNELPWSRAHVYEAGGPRAREEI